MKILVLGAKGSTGRRYVTILKMLSAEVIEYDMINQRNNQNIPKAEAAIIATPTPLHIDYAIKLINMGYKKILIEKPVSKDPKEIGYLMSYSNCEITVVCNWKFSSFGTLKPESHKISYNYYNYGRDLEPTWDMCQLVYLQKGKVFDFAYDSPFFNVTIDGFVISTQDIEKSYYRMIVAWIALPHNLWNLEDGLKMTKKVIDYLNP